MRIVSIILSAFVLTMAGVAMYVRLAPVEIADVAPLQNLQPPGDYELVGGHYAVRPIGTVDLTALNAQIVATARTQHLSGSGQNPPMIFIHRSAVFGFPDITQVWIEEDNVHIYSHLIYGQSDLGVNRDRMRDWLSSSGG